MLIDRNKYQHVSRIITGICFGSALNHQRRLPPLRDDGRHSTIQPAAAAVGRCPSANDNPDSVQDTSNHRQHGLAASLRRSGPPPKPQRMQGDSQTPHGREKASTNWCHRARTDGRKPSTSTRTEEHTLETANSHRQSWCSKDGASGLTLRTATHENDCILMSQLNVCLHSTRLGASSRYLAPHKGHFPGSPQVQEMSPMLRFLHFGRWAAGGGACSTMDSVN